MTNITIKTVTVLIISLLFYPLLAISDTTKNPLEWTPYPAKEIGEIMNSPQLLDIQKVEVLTRYLDKRISLAPIQNPPGHQYPTSNKPNPAGEYAGLIRAIAKKNSRTDSPGRPKAIQSVLNQLDDMLDIVNREQVRCYLYIALAYAGGNPPENILLNALKNPDTPVEILNTVLNAMQNSTVPIRALPRLLELTKSSIHYVFLLDVGPPNPRRIYPIRESALADLTKLGIRAKAVSITDEKVDPDWKVKLSTTVIEVDRKSLVAKLREWLSSDDPNIWQSAAKAARQIPGDDIKAILTNFFNQDKLPAEKK